MPALSLHYASIILLGVEQPFNSHTVAARMVRDPVIPEAPNRPEANSRMSAFPESARIGLEPGQTDPGWWLISLMAKAGLAHDVGAPRAGDSREDLLLAPEALAPSAPLTPASSRRL